MAYLQCFYATTPSCAAWPQNLTVYFSQRASSQKIPEFYSFNIWSQFFQRTFNYWLRCWITLKAYWMLRVTFYVRLNFCEISHKISRALARFSVLAHTDFRLRRSLCLWQFKILSFLPINAATTSTSVVFHVPVSPTKRAGSLCLTHRRRRSTDLLIPDVQTMSKSILTSTNGKFLW